MAVLVLFLTALSAGASSQQSIRIHLAHGSDSERQTQARLEEVLSSYDLSKYAFTDHVAIDELAINHAFPVLTLNVRFANSADELLSSYVHEQLHWHLREHQARQQELIGLERTAAVINHKGHYTWIYRTILHDEVSIAAVVAAHHLQVK